MPPEQGTGSVTSGSENDVKVSESILRATPSQDTEVKTESDRLRDLNAAVRDQDDLERDIGRQADRLLFEQATERDAGRLEKAKAQRTKIELQIVKLKERIVQPIGITQRAKLKNDVERFQGQIDELTADIADIEQRMNEREQDAEKAGTAEAGQSGRLPNESQRDFLIRTGKITPFSKLGLATQGRLASNLQDALLDAEEEPEVAEIIGEVADDVVDDFGGNQHMSHRNLRLPGFGSKDISSSEQDVDSDSPRKRRKISPKPTKVKEEDVSRIGSSDGSAYEQEAASSPSSEDMVYVESGSDTMPGTEAKGKRPRRRRRAVVDEDDGVEDLRGVDDGNEPLYRVRIERWASRRHQARLRANRKLGIGQDDNDEDESEDFALQEAQAPHPEVADTEFENGYKIPGDIFPSLFDYQKTGVRWLWELYSQQVGGIVGDEMGLGKTIQIISFLAGLEYSKKITKPIIVVCPATVMKQWVNEFHRWWPPFRVTILHSSGSGMVNLEREASREEDLEAEMWDPSRRSQPLSAGQKAARRVLKPILEKGGVLVTTYSGLQTYAPLLIPVDWQYAILDEGHKIRNPNTAITIYCKELRTPNRIILSGTPMQNNLIELWSLFDFVFPMRLGTLVSFRSQFEIPIRQGGYANASNLQVQTAFKCAETLKDAISPYLLQRFKVDVAADLPKKSEQVLFCRLTRAQRQAYERFLNSDDMRSILGGRRQVLYGVDILRKICNHPDLQDHKRLSIKPGFDYGNAIKSGKMQVVGSLLDLWKETGHKTLLFAQHRIMLDILEKFIRSMPGFRYRRMDGNTPIQNRQAMVDEFNTNPDLHVFLLTTKVGGLGINLTGADRVIIFDPDWNPSTDLQARERAWRLGQKREVTIYRLMTAGTIEEKIYHRQIFKQFLTNKILRDPKQRQTFHLSDLHDLFTLGDESAPTETSTLFKNAQIKYDNDVLPNSSKPISNDKISAKPSTGDDPHTLKRIAGINSVEHFADAANDAPPDEPNDKTSSNQTTNSESRVMAGIFARSAIHSALEHDAILGSNSSGKQAITADPAVIEAEAKKVAAEAARELKRAGEVARTVPVGTPTWTGTFGVAGRPDEPNSGVRRAFGAGSRGGGISSSSLLAGLQRNAGPASGNASGTSSPSRSAGAGSSLPGTPTPPRGKDFGRLIRDYLVTHGGSVYTQMLIDHFNRFCTTPAATAEFKETLKVIANLEKGNRGRGKWVLKGEFKGGR